MLSIFKIFSYYNIFYNTSIILNFFINEQRIQILVSLLCMPSQGVSINSKSSSFSRRNKILHSIKVHRSIICHARSVFHGITSSHFHKVAVCQLRYLSTCNIIIHSQCNSQLKVGIGTAVYIRFQYVIVIEILHARNRGRFLNVKRQRLVVNTCDERQKQAPK